VGETDERIQPARDTDRRRHRCNLVATGFFVGRLVNIHPIETGIVAACRAS
jgi:hypothetical protein